MSLERSITRIIYIVRDRLLVDMRSRFTTTIEIIGTFDVLSNKLFTMDKDENAKKSNKLANEYIDDLHLKE